MDGRLQFVVNCSILFQELPLLERPAAARRAGFTAIELWWPFPEAVPADRAVRDLVDAIGSADVQLIAMNSFAGDMPAGERGVVSHPHRRNEFRDNLDVLAAIATQLDCKMFNVLYGNHLDDVAATAQREAAVDGLAYAATLMARLDGTILIEALSGIEQYPLKTAADALSVVDAVRRVGPANIAFLYDTFHLAAGGDDLMTVLAEHAALIGHVQLADHPGRGAPGTGALDFAAILQLVEALRGPSWVSLEYLSTAADDQRFGWLRTQ